MDRIYRIEQNGRPEYVLQNDDGTGWRRLDGDLFGAYATGPAIVDGMLYVNSGYFGYGVSRPGNVLLAFGVE